MKKSYVFFVLLLAAFISCNVKEEQELSTDVNALSKNITIAIKPVSAKWINTKIGDGMLGPSDYTIIAVLKYSHADWLSLHDRYQKSDASEAKKLSKDFLMDWYPESVTRCFKKNGNSLSVLKNVYKIDEFAKASFINGFCFFTDNDEVFLYMYTM